MLLVKNTRFLGTHGMEKKKDKITSSPDPAELEKFKEMAKALPEVRQEKVEDIKKQIESGKYVVDAEAVAKSIIEYLREVATIIRRSKTKK